MIFSIDPAKRCQFWGKNMQIFLDVLQERMDAAARANDKEKLIQWSKAREFLASFGQHLTMAGPESFNGVGLIQLEEDLKKADDIMIMMIVQKE